MDRKKGEIPKKEKEHRCTPIFVNLKSNTMKKITWQMYNAPSSSPNISLKIAFLLVLFHKTFRFRTQYYNSINSLA